MASTPMKKRTLGAVWAGDSRKLKESVWAHCDGSGKLIFHEVDAYEIVRGYRSYKEAVENLPRVERDAKGGRVFVTLLRMAGVT